MNFKNTLLKYIHIFNMSIIIFFNTMAIPKIVLFYQNKKTIENLNQINKEIEILELKIIDLKETLNNKLKESQNKIETIKPKPQKHLNFNPSKQPNQIRVLEQDASQKQNNN